MATVGKTCTDDSGNALILLKVAEMCSNNVLDLHLRGTGLQY